MVGVIDEDALEESHGQESDVVLRGEVFVGTRDCEKGYLWEMRAGRSSGHGPSGPRRKASIHSDRPHPLTHLEKNPSAMN